jgi:arsenate reductase (glutaredoxin)
VAAGPAFVERVEHRYNGHDLEAGVLYYATVGTNDDRHRMTITVYGIPNCDTVKQARAWLQANGIDYTFHDYKKSGADPVRLAAWSEAQGWEALLNRAGTTFKQLPAVDRTALTHASAMALMVAWPSLIKRPVVEYPGGLLVGFRADQWAERLTGRAP